MKYELSQLWTYQSECHVKIISYTQILDLFPKFWELIKISRFLSSGMNLSMFNLKYWSFKIWSEYVGHNGAHILIKLPELAKHY